MQRKLRGLNSALTGIVLSSFLATSVLADSDSSAGESQLRWVSPSRTRTLENFKEEASKSGKGTSSATGRRVIRTWESTANRSKQDARIAPLPQNESPRQTPKGKESQGLKSIVKGLDIGDVKQTPEATEQASPEPATQENPRVAGRFFRNRAPEVQQNQSPIPWMETMHPTEQQVDDRRRPNEPPVDLLPTPSRDSGDLEDGGSELKPLTTSQQRMRSKIRRVLAYYYNRPLNTSDRSPWEVIHCILSYELHSKVRRDGPDGEPVTAIGWMCFNQPCKKRTLMYINDEGELRVRVGPALQGHRGQLLAMLAWSNVSENYPMRVEGHDLTVADLVEMEKRTCFPGSEHTFKLIGLMHYLPSDAEWTNEQGMEWNLPKLVYEESRESLRDAACGGTHRLTGLTLAYKTREERGEPVNGAYLRAQQYVAKHKNYAYRLQNRDGSFSTEWFRGPGNDENIDRKLKTTGHILEWMLYAAEQQDLRSSRIHRAANYLANTMYDNRTHDWDAGALGHAVHALLLYDRLMFVPHDREGVLPMASTSTGSDRTNSRSRSNRSSSSQYRQSSNSRMRR